MRISSFESQAFANHLLGNFGIRPLRPQVRRVADKVEQMRKCVLTVQDALDVEKDEPFDSSGPRRLRNVPADPGSTDDVQHPAASEVDEGRGEPELMDFAVKTGGRLTICPWAASRRSRAYRRYDADHRNLGRRTDCR